MPCIIVAVVSPSCQKREVVQRRGLGVDSAIMKSEDWASCSVVVVHQLGFSWLWLNHPSRHKPALPPDGDHGYEGQLSRGLSRLPMPGKQIRKLVVRVNAAKGIGDAKTQGDVMGGGAGDLPSFLLDLSRREGVAARDATNSTFDIVRSSPACHQDTLRYTWSKALLTRQTSPTKISQLRQHRAAHASLSPCGNGYGGPLMKYARSDLSSKHLAIPRLATPSWFLVRPQLPTRV
jgi:hypothetical protein